MLENHHPAAAQEAAPNYKIVISEHTWNKIRAYQGAILEEAPKQPGVWGENNWRQLGVGQYLASKLAADSITPQKLAALTPAEFLDCLLATKKPLVFAESQVRCDGSDWNKIEASILGDVGVAIPGVTIFDDGYWRGRGVPPGTIYGSQSKKKGSLFVMAAPQLRQSEDGQSLVEPHNNADFCDVTTEDGLLDFDKYYTFLENRLLPGLVNASKEAAARGKKAVVTTPGLGCGQFAGVFAEGEVIHTYLYRALNQLLEKHHHKLGGISALYCNLFVDDKSPYPETYGEIDGGIDLLIGGRGDAPQFPDLSEEWEGKYKTHELVKVVAGDGFSRVGNDANGRVDKTTGKPRHGLGTTDEGAAAQATDALTKMTGVPGEYNPAEGTYRPENNQYWFQCLEHAPFTATGEGQLKVVNSEGDIVEPHNAADDAEVVQLREKLQGELIQQQLKLEGAERERRRVADDKHAVEEEKEDLTLTIDWSRELKEQVKAIFECKKLGGLKDHLKCLMGELPIGDIEEGIDDQVVRFRFQSPKDLKAARKKLTLVEKGQLLFMPDSLVELENLGSANALMGASGNALSRSERKIVGAENGRLLSFSSVEGMQRIKHKFVPPIEEVVEQIKVQVQGLEEIQKKRAAQDVPDNRRSTLADNVTTLMNALYGEYRDAEQDRAAIAEEQLRNLLGIVKQLAEGKATLKDLEGYEKKARQSPDFWRNFGFLVAKVIASAALFVLAAAATLTVMALVTQAIDGFSWMGDGSIVDTVLDCIQKPLTVAIAGVATVAWGGSMSFFAAKSIEHERWHGMSFKCDVKERTRVENVEVDVQEQVLQGMTDEIYKQQEDKSVRVAPAV